MIESRDVQPASRDSVSLRRSSGILLAALLSLALLGQARAAALPVTPDPASCEVDPVSISRLEELAAADVEPVSSLPEDLPAASEDVQIAIEEVVLGATACTNANQPLRAFAYFTDRYLSELFGADDFTLLGHLAVATTREPQVAPETERLTIETIDNVRSDGTVTIATVTTSNRETRYVDQLTFRDVDGAWLIDGVEPVEQAPVATSSPEAE